MIKAQITHNIMKSITKTNLNTLLDKRTCAPHWIYLSRTTHKNELQYIELYNKHYCLVKNGEQNKYNLINDACKHRGLSLSLSGKFQYSEKTKEAGVCCGYHNRHFACKGLDNYDVNVSQDDVWLDVNNSSDTNKKPPMAPEFDDTTYKTIAYNKIVNVNPILMMKNLLDFAHLCHVHKYTIVDGIPEVVIEDNGDHSRSMYTYYDKNGKITIKVENEYWIPFTSMLRFYFGEKNRLVLWFSFRPESKNKTVMNMKIARNFARADIMDGIMQMIDEIPLQEDIQIVRNIYTDEWEKNALDSEDKHIINYRRNMKLLYPEIVNGIMMK
jgi:phenylpropionate dioxygenase-like ring-hydroxylating dioxygenase large terminal subunit